MSMGGGLGGYREARARKEEKKTQKEKGKGQPLKAQKKLLI